MGQGSILLRSQLVVVFSALLLATASCATRSRPEPLVPEENRQASEEMYGQQMNSMDSLNQTSSEQAGAAHDNAVRDARSPDREKNSR